MTRNGRIRFQPHDCVVCGRIHEPVVLDAEKYYRWKKGGECIQDVFPDSEMTKDQREILISGTCPECWDVLFGRCEDEDLELENTPKNEIPTTAAEAEQMQREQMDRMNAAVEIERIREDYIWDQRELEQRAKDLKQLEEIEERARMFEKMEEMNRLSDELEEMWENEYSLNPVNDSLFGSF